MPKKSSSDVREVKSGGRTRYEAVNEPSAMTFDTPEKAEQRAQVVRAYSHAFGRTK